MSADDNNANTGVNMSRILRALALLREKVDDVLAAAPHLLAMRSLDELPQHIKDDVEDKLWAVFCYGEYYVEKLMVDLSAPMLSLPEPGDFDFYYGEYAEFRKKMRRLLHASMALNRKQIELSIVHSKKPEHGGEDCTSHTVYLQSDIDQYMDFYEKLMQLQKYHQAVKGIVHQRIELANGNLADMQLVMGHDVKRINVEKINFDEEIFDESPISIKKSMENSFEVVEENFLDGFTHEEIEYWETFNDLSACNLFIRKPYFKPDDWVGNEKKLSPIVVTTEQKKIPQHIQNRVHEIYYSMVFGHWMASIALSRCLLEYALSERKSSLEKRLDKKIDIKNANGHNLPIRKLAGLWSCAFPDLEDSMGIVIENGNSVMHHSKKNIPSEKRAMQSFVAIQKIIGTLYRP